MVYQRVVMCIVFLCFCSSNLLGQATTLPGGDNLMTSKERVGVATLAGDYLVGTIQKDGRFIYDYSPKKSKAGTDYNWLRHCGTVMSLCQLYEKTRNEKYLIGAEKSIPVFLKQIKDVTIGDKVYKGFVSETSRNEKVNASVKTGGCALAAIALMKYDACKKTKDNKATVLGLCSFIRQTQMTSGELRSKFIVKKNSEESYYDDFRSLFYQGEALLALAMAQTTYPTTENQACMLRLLNYLAYEWAAALDRPRKEMFDHWGMIGLSRAYALVNDNHMKTYQAEYLKMMTDYVKALQDKLKSDISHFDRVVMGRRLMEDEAKRNTIVSKGPMVSATLLSLGFDYCENELMDMIRPTSNRYRGSFFRSAGRVCPTATRIEGISAFGSLVMATPKCTYQLRVKEWSHRVDLARRFIKKCQYTEYDAKRFKSPIPIVGGIRDHLDWKRRDTIRIDYCQHSISALLGW